LSYSTHANRKKKKKVFQPNNLVWNHLRKERFAARHKNKVMSRANGVIEVLERIDDNAYKVDLPEDYRVSATFNIADLSPYEEDDYLYDLRSNPIKQ